MNTQKSLGPILLSLIGLLALLGGSLTGKVLADDTDIYLKAGLTNSGGEPMVMFVLDYRSNLGSSSCGDLNDAKCAPIRNYLIDAGFTAGQSVRYFDTIVAAMKQVIDPLENVKIGLMMSHDNSCSGGKNGPTVTTCSNGAYILNGFTSIGAATVITYNSDGTFASVTRSAGKQEFFDILNAIPTDSTGQPFQGKEIYFELFRYLTGQNIHNAYAAYDDVGHDYSVATPENIDVFGVPFGTRGATGHPLLAWDEDIIDTSVDPADPTTHLYISPLTQDCGKVFVVNMMDLSINGDGDSDDAIEASTATFTNQGAELSPTDRTKGGMEGINLVDWNSTIQWMYDIDLAPHPDEDGSTPVFGDPSRGPSLHGKQNVTSFLLTANYTNNTAQDIANAGGTAAIHFNDDPAVMVAALESLFTQILSVSTTFVSAAIPVNVFNRAEITDNVYVALFKADEASKPRWPGNLKKLKLTFDTNGNLVMQDASAANAISASDGRINYDALTYWTDGANLPAPDPNLNEVTGKDGRSVARGGAGQKIPGFIADTPQLLNATAGARQMFTEPDSYTNGTATTLRALNADSTTATTLQTDLGAVDANEAEELLMYIRGFDIDNIDGDNNTETRPWLLEDPLHSRPLPINYGGSTTNPDIRIVMGTNGGLLHMFRNTTSLGAQDGSESWAFMPKAVMPVAKRLRANLAGSPIHPYAVDGAPVAYTVDVDNDGNIETADGDKVYVYFGLRRGGKAYYALDISNPDTPKMLWSITKTGDFAELGMTFSIPKIGKIDYDGNGKKPVLIFGGGYDTNKDSAKTDDSEGNAIYIVDAVTGALVWKAVGTGTASTTVKVHANMVDSIPSNITAIDTSGNGAIDRLYVGDTGGVVWRADLAGARSSWSINRLASLGRHHNGGPTNDRRFFHAPDFVKSKDGTGYFDAVVIGSGDRADPLDLTVDNALYMIKDRAITSGSPTADASFLQVGNLDDLTNNCLQDTDVTCGSPPPLTNGWRLTLEQNGEKSLATPFTLSGTVFFSTFVPADSSASVTCGPSEGTGRYYAVGLQDAKAVYNNNSSTDADGGGELQKEDRFVTSKNGGIPSEHVYIPSYTDANGNTVGGMVMTSDFDATAAGGNGTWRTFWYEVE